MFTILELPKLPEGFYWRYDAFQNVFGLGPQVLVRIYRQRKYWFDAKVDDETCLLGLNDKPNDAIRGLAELMDLRLKNNTRDLHKEMDE